MSLTDAGRDLAIDAIVGGVSHMGLHTAFPATSGNELTGGTPAYARKAVTWGAATGSGSRTRAINEQPIFDVPAGSTVSSAGGHSALTAGTLHVSGDLTDESYGSQGQYQLTAFSVTVT